MEVIARDEHLHAAFVELVDLEGNFLRAAIPYPHVDPFTVGTLVEVRLRVAAHAGRRDRSHASPERRKHRLH